MNATPNSIEPAPTPPSFPKLAIWHVLLWMACICVVGGWHNSSFSMPSGSWWLQAHQLIGASTYTILAGLALAGLVMAIGCAVRGHRFYPRTAGHWMLTVSGLVMVCSETSNWVREIWHYSHPGWNQTDVGEHVMAYSFAISALLYIGAAVAVQDMLRWRFVFVGYAAGCAYWSIVNFVRSYGDENLGYFLSRYGFAFQWPWQWLLVVVILILSVMDFNQRRRDWMHWTGIVYQFLQVLTQSLLIATHAFFT